MIRGTIVGSLCSLIPGTGPTIARSSPTPQEEDRQEPADRQISGFFAGGFDAFLVQSCESSNFMVVRSWGKHLHVSGLHGLSPMFSSLVRQVSPSVSRVPPPH